ncbi:hypothetical protein ACFW42_22480 [Streptomyces albidoflavus]
MLASLGRHVILSTHDVADLEASYDHVVVLDAGQVRYQGGVAGFLALAPEGTAPGRVGEAAYHHTVGDSAWV